MAIPVKPVTRAKPKAARVKEKKSSRKHRSVALNGAKLYTLPLKEKILLARTGIAKNQITALKDQIDVDYNQMATMLVASRASLISKGKGQRFNSIISERFLLINDLVEYGRKIFGDNNVFKKWLKAPSEALGNVAPLSMLDTVYGIDEVKKEIGRIAYGVY